MNQAVLPRPEQDPDHLVGDSRVHAEEVAEQDGGRVVVLVLDSVLVDNLKDGKSMLGSFKFGKSHESSLPKNTSKMS